MKVVTIELDSICIISWPAGSLTVLLSSFSVSNFFLIFNFQHLYVFLIPWATLTGSSAVAIVVYIFHC